MTVIKYYDGKIWDYIEDQFGEWYVCRNCGEYGYEPFEECAICGISTKTFDKLHRKKEE